MTLFKTFTLKWWQAAIFKLGIWALAIAVGAYWHTLFAGFLIPLVAVGVLCLGYVTYIWSKQ